MGYWWVFRLWKLWMQKKLVDKLVDECIETVEEVKLANTIFTENENSYECITCTVHIVLLSVFFAFNVGGIVTYHVYWQWYLKKYSQYVDFIICKGTTIY